jgi:hypothetical protein
MSRVPLTIADALHRRAFFNDGGRRPPMPSPRKRGEGEEAASIVISDAAHGKLGGGLALATGGRSSGRGLCYRFHLSDLYIFGLHLA